MSTLPLSVGCSLTMELHMFGRTQNHQVRHTVVGFVSVDVMDMFVTAEMASEMLFHHQPMLRHPVACGAWVVGSEDAHVSLRSYVSATTPLRCILAVLSGLVPASTATEAASNAGRRVPNLAGGDAEWLTTLGTRQGDALALPTIRLFPGECALVSCITRSGAKVTCFTPFGRSTKGKQDTAVPTVGLSGHCASLSYETLDTAIIPRTDPSPQAA